MNILTTTKQIAIIAVVLLLFTAQRGSSLTLAKASVEELTTESTLIIKGVVHSTESQWEDANHRAINTYVTVDVSRYIKGAGESQIVFKQKGGQIGDTSDIISGTPYFRKGDEVLLFLVESNGVYEIHSFALGCFRIFTDTKFNEQVINDLRNVDVIDPATGKRVSPQDAMKPFSLDAFIGEVKSYVSSK